eukprot:1160098-Pelagomonas_calceolata.AAC.6
MQVLRLCKRFQSDAKEFANYAFEPLSVVHCSFSLPSPSIMHQWYPQGLPPPLTPPRAHLPFPYRFTDFTRKPSVSTLCVF